MLRICKAWHRHNTKNSTYHNLRWMSQKKGSSTPPRSLLYRDTSVLTQGGLFSQRDPCKLREFNQQLDEHREYQDKLLPDMPFKYEDDSLVISPTIRNSKYPVPRSMHYNDEAHTKHERDAAEQDTYPQLEYFDIANAQQYYQQTQSQRYYNMQPRKSSMTQTIQPSHSNINVRLQRLFYSDTPHKQPSEETVQELLSKPADIDAGDMMMKGGHSAFDAEQQKKQLEFEALKLEQEADKEEAAAAVMQEEVEEEEFEADGELFDFSRHLDEMETTPNFKKLFPDDAERDIAIDQYLQKAPQVEKQEVPPDAVVLPVYGQLKDYERMLNIERNVIAATLRHLGIYTQNIITQEAGQQLVEHLRPNTEIILEQLVDELTPRVPYDKRSDDYFKLSKRKPVICILGHVDHGKTTLLDYLRHSHVAEQEAGGITQSIGAFGIDMVEFAAKGNFTPHYDEIVVFDTPGHAAFSGMRQRGAHVVDLAILVVDACDGVKPQTKESLAIVRKEKLPFIVAINKIDRAEAEPANIRRELEELGVFADETEMVEISAKTGQGVTQLLEMVDIVCELEDPRGDHESNAELVVVEARKSTADGTVINALVQDGKLKNGDMVFKMKGFDKDSHAKISRLQDFKGNLLDSAGPSTPVSFLGFHKHLPEIGTILIAAHDKQHAADLIKTRETHEYYRNKLKIHARVSASQPKLHDPTAAMATHHSHVEDPEEDALDVHAKWTTTPYTNDPRQLNIWIRADTWGSIEAIENYLYQIVIPNQEYYFQIINKDIGALHEQTIRECDSRNCYILNFNVPIKKGSYKAKHVKVFDSNIIFELFDKFIENLEEKLAPIEQHTLCGRAYVKEVFEVKETDKELKGAKDTARVAGCIVETGKIKFDGHYRVRRNGKIVYEQWGVSELKHFAIQVDEVECGDECGLKLQFEDWQPEDMVECLEIVQEKNKIAPPIFEMDASLQQSLYGAGALHAGEAVGDEMIHESRTVFSYADDRENEEQISAAYEDYEDENEFMGQHKNVSDAPRVKATKNKKGKVVFEAVEK